MGPLDLLRPDPAPRWGGPSRRNAYVELHNLIAAAGSAREFGPSDRGRISRQHGVDLAREFQAERVALYQTILDDRLANGDLDADDRQVLAHVAATLALGPADLRPAHERAFGTAVSEAVADDCLSVAERLLLYKLQHLLGLDPRLADGAYDVIARQRLLRTVAEALCDGELAPDEEARIALAESALSVTLPPDARAMLAQARRRWQAYRGALPAADLGAGLQPGETGHYQAGARWAFVDGEILESQLGRQVVHTGRTAGLSVPRRALSGPLRSGHVAVTSRRLLLTPEAGLPDEYRLEGVVQTLRFVDGVVVRMRTGRRIYVDPGSDLVAFYAVLYRAAQAAGSAGPD